MSQRLHHQAPNPKWRQSVNRLIVLFVLLSSTAELEACILLQKDVVSRQRLSLPLRSTILLMLFTDIIFLMLSCCNAILRVGLQGDSSDPRTKSFLHLMDLILRMSRPPDYILMENVKGFESSQTREQFVTTLNNAGYYFQEFLLSPNQFGIPNSRLRYYMLAKRKPHQFYFETQQKILTSIPEQEESSENHNCTCSKTITLNKDVKINSSTDNKSISSNQNTCSIKTKNMTSNLLQTLSQNGQEKTVQSENPSSNKLFTFSLCGSRNGGTLSEFLEPENDDYFQQFLLPEKVLSKFALVLDIVTPFSTHSCCFTKAYGHYAEGTGSVLKMADIDDVEYFDKYRSLDPSKSDSQRAKVLRDLKLRYFTPREVANIMCFPKSFGFPEGTTSKQKYRLLGNSLNIHVVTELLRCLLRDS